MRFRVLRIGFSRILHRLKIYGELFEPNFSEGMKLALKILIDYNFFKSIFDTFADFLIFLVFHF
jgi:hypothetical protein